jgi:FixJ family two-component response regulator
MGEWPSTASCSRRSAESPRALGVKSVETYRARVMEKLGLRSRSDLVRFALERGILAPGASA